VVRVNILPIDFAYCHRQGRYNNHHSIKNEEQRLISHPRIPPSTSHLMDAIYASDKNDDVSEADCPVEYGVPAAGEVG
jgi:hypothetical protein